MSFKLAKEIEDSIRWVGKGIDKWRGKDTIQGKTLLILNNEDQHLNNKDPPEETFKIGMLVKYAINNAAKTVYKETA